ncbi:MAG: DUF1259 domain-containing protein [Acidobacteria bacterium]|nr:DUF1259 domain-containing protein [Acidobacteriota bacterium]
MSNYFIGREQGQQATTRKAIHAAARFWMLLATVLIINEALVNCATVQKPSSSTPAQTTPAEWKAVEAAIGKAGTMQPGDVYKVSFPRSDLVVKVRGVQLKPALALGSWVAFKRMGSAAMVMGDLVLTEEEVTPVMSKLQEGGIEQTALHNHVLDESPRVMYMHIGGHGDDVKIAQAIHAALMLTGTPFNSPPASTQPLDIGLDTKQLEQLMGYGGKLNGGVYQFSIPRAEEITEGDMQASGHGMTVPSSMGTATAINFQPTGGGKAAITGDFVLLATEVNPVIRALRAGSIEVTALHSHMLDEHPRLFFMHFWANDDALKLARGLRSALNQTNSHKPQSK